MSHEPLQNTEETIIFLYHCLSNYFTACSYFLHVPSFRRAVAEPAVTLRNLPDSYTEEALMKLFDLYKPVRAELSTVDGVLEGVVVLGGPADVDLASIAMSR